MRDLLRAVDESVHDRGYDLATGFLKSQTRQIVSTDTGSV